MSDNHESFEDRLWRICEAIALADNFKILIERDKEVPNGRFYFQIAQWRPDAITGEMGWGFGGKAYLSEHSSDSELVQTVFGLYKAFWEHEARETFKWRGRRVFGPHISTEALWEVARRVDVRKPIPEPSPEIDDRPRINFNPHEVL